MTQTIRPSQFVLVYGPGAILETKDGPRIIPEAEKGLFWNRDVDRSQFKIIDVRMTEGLLDGAEIFRLPSNAELMKEPNTKLYRTKRFPVWKLCMNTEHGEAHVLYEEDATRTCPLCGNGVTGAIRFVLACPDGHLDEVPWNYLVHRSAKCTNPDGARRGKLFHWKGGSTISSIFLKCPGCGASASLGEAYYADFPCTGRHPQKEQVDYKPVTPGCEKRAKIIQRQASNIRIPEVRTLFSIRPVATKLHVYLSDPVIRGALVDREPLSKEGLVSLLESLRDKRLIRPRVVNEIRNADKWEIVDALQEDSWKVGVGFKALLEGEFRELVRASIRGAPPSDHQDPKSGKVFEVDPTKIRKAKGPNGTEFLVTPIRRLRTVTVQTGFRRAVGSKDDVQETVDIGEEGPDGKKWYPGVEFLGEGIFVRMSGSNTVSGTAANGWAAANGDAYGNRYLFRDTTGSYAELDPVFVWWHTLSHALIRTISEYAGYSSSSIRERVYLDDSAGTKTGGIVLYATQPGNDGTMGGLISLVPHFESILETAMEGVVSCSGDPLCRDQVLESMKLNGAACYGCVMNSETSCEHRNMWLDRHVLMENMP